ncbi:TetR/AcrR family transcriptional regulator [Aeromicrobium phragmitis]|uniref:TetR/AcrR family transcriptional regulator n=2 Tax=Aeromicrobium phragmitis TaxID=2478914 RepID=A0A3L8PN19_9ACTN|nr:TetR/AcrR family transcriptional regulator [Aeromicrobium phragmitis]
MTLFAQQGYAATSVGAIEKAAGLAPRRGAMYRHFPSKQALLEAVLDEHVAAVRASGDLAPLVSHLPLAEQLRQMAELMLALMESTRDLSRIFEREGERVPELRERFRTGVIDEAVHQARRIISPWLDDEADAEALAVVLTGPIVNFMRNRWTFGDSPAGLTEERFLDAWCESAIATLARRGDPPILDSGASQ